jgi:choline dehydrogenase-like flavoprotein
MCAASSSGPRPTNRAPYRVRQNGRMGERGDLRLCGRPVRLLWRRVVPLPKRDFDPPPEIVGDSGAAWPIGYAALEPWYGEAERLLGVAGEAGVDPTEPPGARSIRSRRRRSRRSPRASRSRRAHGPAPVPDPAGAEPFAGWAAVCSFCTTCDAYACWNGAKNDLATRVITPLLERGLTLRGPDRGHATAQSGRGPRRGRGVRGPRERGARATRPSGSSSPPARSPRRTSCSPPVSSLNPAGDARGSLPDAALQRLRVRVLPTSAEPGGCASQAGRHQRLLLRRSRGWRSAGEAGQHPADHGAADRWAVGWTRRLGERGRPVQTASPARCGG